MRAGTRMPIVGPPATQGWGRGLHGSDADQYHPLPETRANLPPARERRPRHAYSAPAARALAADLPRPGIKRPRLSSPGGWGVTRSNSHNARERRRTAVHKRPRRFQRVPSWSYVLPIARAVLQKKRADPDRTRGVKQVIWTANCERLSFATRNGSRTGAVLQSSNKVALRCHAATSSSSTLHW
jgi:hypothetical protein